MGRAEQGWTRIAAPQRPEAVEVVPTRSLAGRAQSARRARSSCSRQLPVGSIVSTFTQVPGLEETGRSKKTEEQRCLNSSTNTEKRPSRKTSVSSLLTSLQNTRHLFFVRYQVLCTQVCPLLSTCRTPKHKGPQTTRTPESMLSANIK